jgi:putative membrane protein
MTRSASPLALAIERAGSRQPVTWLTILGALLLPVIVGGVLVAALYNPVERLDSMSAAIVNDDEPVTIDGQTVPLGRQLTAGLLEGSDDIPSNLAWTITNDDDAREGLADGSYAAVIRIPENFSAAAMSTAPGSGTPEQATIEVRTPPDSLVVDDAISAQVTQAAASLLGTSLSEVYLENVFLGFTTLGDQLGTAADGANQLADGAGQAAEGAAQLPSGATQLAGGAGQLSTGATSLASGLSTISGGIGQSASGVGQLIAGLNTAADQIAAPDLVSGAQTAAGYTQQSSDGATALAQSLGALAQQCGTGTLDPALCAQVGEAAQSAADLAYAAGAADYATDQVSAGVSQLTSQSSSGLRTAAAQAQALQSGLTQLRDGTAQSADGARALAAGAGELQSGATQLADGAQSLADGVAQLETGTSELAAGLSTAVEEVPSYTDSEAQNLASVVADPVAAEGVGTNLFGASAVPLVVMVALWFGGLATFVALRAVTARTLASRRPSALLALRGLAPAAVIGALQGVLVAAVVQMAAGYDWADWSLFAVVAAVAGVAFAGVNQALVAVFGGAGRWISAVIGVLAVATGVVSTVPGVISAIAGLLPTAPAYDGMLAALTAADGLGAAIVGLVVWAVLAFVATTVAVARRRSVPARALLAASPA